MPDQEQNSANTQRAAHFFQQPERIRLLEELYTKYMALGRIGGQVLLRKSTLEERREIASFLGKRMSTDEDIVVRLIDFQQALLESSFPCALPDLLHALFPQRPQRTSPQQREQRVRQQETFRAALEALEQTFPDQSNAHHWLQTGTYGKDTLFSRYKNESEETQQQQLKSISTVALALNSLPTLPHFERLARFSERISGDPHYFDFNTASGRLFFSALSDLAQSKRGDDSGQQASLAFSPEHISAAERAEADTPASASMIAADRVLLYYDMGLLLDTLSSTVAIYNLAHAKDLRGELDPLIELAGNRILVLPLRQLLNWRELVPTPDRVYIVENPQVFESIVDALEQEDGRPHPTLICTSGWPSAAAIRSLDLLFASSPTTSLHYSGDFDLAGLRIAARLLERYPSRCHLWRFDPATYLAALHTRSIPLNAPDLSDLQFLPSAFAPLVAVMREHGKKAYQEGIVQQLLDDMRNA